VTVVLFYDAATHVPECSNDQEMLALARSHCSAYEDFFAEMLIENAPYLPIISNDKWRDYGFELRLNRLAVRYPRTGDGVLYDGPVTLIKEYGSTEVTAH
jgi:hypothetical protein